MKIIFAFSVSILLNHPNSQIVSRDTVTAANTLVTLSGGSAQPQAGGGSHIEINISEIQCILTLKSCVCKSE